MTEGLRAQDLLCGAICKGSWVLGTACGRCAKCRDEALGIVGKLMPAYRRLQEQMTMLVAVLPRGGHGYDYSDEYKVQCFEEARRIAYEFPENKGAGR